MDFFSFILTLIMWIIAIGVLIFLVRMIFYTGGNIRDLIAKILGFKK